MRCGRRRHRTIGTSRPPLRSSPGIRAWFTCPPWTTGGTRASSGPCSASIVPASLTWPRRTAASWRCFHGWGSTSPRVDRCSRCTEVRSPDDDRLLACLDLGRSRTLYQDPSFGIRQLVDVATQALSPAINQPSTAVQVIDRLHDLLLRIARAPVPTGFHADAAGVVRVVEPTLTPAHLLLLAYQEVSQLGASSWHVTRRLAAAYEDLGAEAPDSWQPTLTRLRSRSSGGAAPRTPGRTAPACNPTGWGSGRAPMDILDELFELSVVVAVAALAPVISALIPKVRVPQVVILIFGGIAIGEAGLDLEVLGDPADRLCRPRVRLPPGRVRGGTREAAGAARSSGPGELADLGGPGHGHRWGSWRPRVS